MLLDRGRGWRGLTGVVLVLVLALPTPAPAQWASNRGYQLLQRVDDVLFGVDNLSLVILDRRYVAGTAANRSGCWQSTTNAVLPRTGLGWCTLMRSKVPAT